MRREPSSPDNLRIGVDEHMQNAELRNESGSDTHAMVVSHFSVLILHSAFGNQLSEIVKKTD